MRALACSLFLVLFAACGPDVGLGGNVVGGHCFNSGDCQYRCEVSGHYPDGLCTIPCANDAQCPAGTACIDDSGGICAVLCTVVRSCAEFGSSYTCQNRDHKGSGGDVPVCRVP